MKRLAYIILAFVVFAGFLPVFGVLWASWFADAHNCRLSEANPAPCIVNGTDWGGTLYTFAVGSWFALSTVPISLLAALAMAVMALAGWINKRRNLKS